MGLHNERCTQLQRTKQFFLLVSLWTTAAMAVLAAIIADWNATLYPVHGSVLIDGHVPHGARLQFHPLEVDAWMPTAPTAEIAVDGTFEVKTLGMRPGARPGKYAVTITWNKPQLDQEEIPNGPNLLPSRYANAVSTPWRIEVNPESNRLALKELSFTSLDYAEDRPFQVSKRTVAD